MTIVPPEKPDVKTPVDIPPPAKMNWLPYVVGAAVILGLIAVALIRG
jgi:hypothetical protein